MKWLPVIAILLVAGCMDPGQPDVTPADACGGGGLRAPPSGPGFDGEAALAWVEEIVYHDGELRPRVPSLEGHTCTSRHLAEALAVDGWTVTRDSFPASQYIDLPKGSASSWARESWCGAEEYAELQDFTFHNLIAVKPGDDSRTLLLGAHWDAKEDASDGGIVPAANDGASGMGVLLELQRVLADIELPYTVAIAFFDGEDGFNDCHPLAGSIHFAATMQIRVDRLILLDMVGDIDARFPREQHSRNSDPALQDLVWSKAPDHGLDEQFTDTIKSVVDDHRPFIDAGIPSIDIIDYDRPSTGFPPYWHTSQDTPDKLSADMMGRMGELLLDVMQDRAFVEEWPEKVG